MSKWVKGIDNIMAIATFGLGALLVFGMCTMFAINVSKAGFYGASLIFVALGVITIPLLIAGLKATLSGWKE